MRVFIGYDPREARAADAAAISLYRVSGITPEFLDAERLRAVGLLTRPADHRGGQDYDFPSQAPASTRFAISRFLTPILCQSGFALFVDCDVVFLRDPREMKAFTEHAVRVVKHDHRPTQLYKMVNQQQTTYPRKNWSSVMLFNCDHPANRRLSLRDVNERPGRDLHAFYWLHDDEIGELGPEWNWLVDVEPRPDNLGIAHMTLGGPWLKGWQGGSFDREWEAAAG